MDKSSSDFEPVFCYYIAAVATAGTVVVSATGGPVLVVSSTGGPVVVAAAARGPVAAGVCETSAWGSLQTPLQHVALAVSSASSSATDRAD